tara:strand:- start:1002 stop:2237 length:1236 start_codon:yes stop_codon:yes gene_type:complete
MNHLVVYPGRFHPFHKGHASVYAALVKKFGADKVFIATSDKVLPPKSPFTFEEKKKMMIHTGIPASAIIQTKNPYQAQELVANYDPANTILMFAVSDKDMAEDPRFTFKPKKDGSPSYFQKAGKGMESLDKHGYIVSVPTLSFKVLGEPMKSATEFRSNFAKADDDMQEQMITDLFGSYNPEIHELMKAKITEHSISDLHTKYSMEAAGAGIVTKQNATKDVPVGGEFDNVKKLSLSSKKKKPFISRMEAVIKEVQLLKQDKTLTFEDSNKINAKLEQLKSVVQIHNNTAIVESLYTLDREDIMNSEVLVQGVGRYTIKSLMANVHSKLKDLASKASTLTNGGMPSDFKDIKSHLDSGIVQLMVSSLETAFDDIEKKRRAGGKQSQGIPKNVFDSFETDLRESWTRKQKRK